jgi:hypothetical protein
MARNRYSSTSSGTPMKANTHDAENRPAILGDRKDLLVGGVGSLELTVFSIEHALLPDQTRSMIFSPNSPCGLNSRKTSASW